MDELVEIRKLEKENAGSEFEEEAGHVCNYNERITERRIPICVFLNHQLFVSRPPYASWL